VHNFIDGLVIAASFAVSFHFGAITSLVIIFHEIPQEIGDFGVLLYGGFSKKKALFFNFVTALTCVLGTIVGYPLAKEVNNFSVYLLPITAGGFIYIAACDLIPEIHKHADQKRSLYSMVAFLGGIIFILLARAVGSH
jgi:zinc and cadmium transporter